MLKWTVLIESIEGKVGEGKGVVDDGKGEGKCKIGRGDGEYKISNGPDPSSPMCIFGP